MKQRAITSVFIVLATIIAVVSKFLPLNIGNYIFDIFVLLIALVASFEIATIIEKTGRKVNKFLATMYSIFNYIVLLVSINYLNYLYVILVEFAALFIYGIISYIYECVVYKQDTNKEHLQATLNTVLACVYPTFLFCLMLIINHIDKFTLQYTSILFITLIMAITWLTDTFAYLVGSTVRGPKLAPKISPNKTISGAIGGLIGGVGGAMLVYLLAVKVPVFVPVVNLYNLTWWHFLVLGIIGSVLGQVGDIFESLLKRKACIKDSGAIFPGHGGMLDRIDAMTFVIATIFVAMIIIL